MNGGLDGWKDRQESERKSDQEMFLWESDIWAEKQEAAVMIVLQEKFQKEEIPSSQGMKGFGLSEEEEGQGGWSVVEATRGSGDSERGGDWSPNRDTMRTKDGKQ